MSEEKNKLKGVGGWLTFFIVTQILGIIISVGFLVITLTEVYNPIDKIISPLSILIAIVWQSLCIYIISKELAGAREFTIKLLGTILFDYVFGFLIYMNLYSKYPLSTEEIYFMQLGFLIRFGITTILWILYFIMSKRVKNTFKTSKSNWVYKTGNIFMIVSIILTIISYLGSAIYDNQYYQDNEKLLIESESVFALEQEWINSNCEYEYKDFCEDLANRYNSESEVFNKKIDEMTIKYPHYYGNLEE